MTGTVDLYKYEIVHLNVRGARSNKRNLEAYLAEMNLPEIVCLNETKLPFNKKFEIEGYIISARREHSSLGGSRGSMILTRQDLKNVIEIEEAKELFKYDEVFGIKIKHTASRPGIKIFSYYNPLLCMPNIKVFQYISALQGHCILTGDLNCKNTAWGSTKSDNRGNELLDILSVNNLIVYNDMSKTRCVWEVRSYRI
jgi:hypothetical protein